MSHPLLSAPAEPNWLMSKLRNARNKWQRRSIFGENDIEARFTRTYELNYWGNDESRSGSGSTLAFTESVRAALPKIIADFNIRSMFDAPCGDWNWMKVLRPTLPISYIGGDIVRQLIEQNQQTYAGPDTQFVHADITKDPLPEVDLWFCRDCLFHLSIADTMAALHNYVRSGIPYLLTTTYDLKGHTNTDILSGDWRILNLMTAPYNLPSEPLARFEDYRAPEKRREMCLWSREQVARGLGMDLGSR